MLHEEKVQLINDVVRKYLIKDNYNNLPFNLTMSEEEHIIEIGASIILHKWQVVTYQPGGFVNAFLSNDLETTYAKADGTIRKAIGFYCVLCANLPKPENI